MLNTYVESLGCPKNLVDTERLLAALGKINIMEDIYDANLVIINTCAFITSAVEESIHNILQSIEDLKGNTKKDTKHDISKDIKADIKKDMHTQTDLNPVFIAVAGCLIGRYDTSELTENMPQVDLWLEPACVDLWGSQLLQALAEKGFLSKEDAQRRKNAISYTQRVLSTPASYSWLKISDGCRQQCSFCTIPSIRGKYHSERPEILEEEAKLLLAKGVKELILVGQDTTSWGTDLNLNHKDLRPLLERLFPLKGLERLRIMYMYPSGLTHELLKFLSKAGKKFVPYFDVPLQHAHPEILARMGRPFAEDPQKVVDRIRTYFPDAAIRTTMMVGFPGETQAHFDTLVDFIVQNKFHHLGVFAFEPEEGTVAATLPDQIDEKVKQERRQKIMALQTEISENILATYDGSRMQILVDAPHEEWPGLYIGRTWFQAPEVDGITYISASPDSSPINVADILEADITETKIYDLVALT